MNLGKLGHGLGIEDGNMQAQIAHCRATHYN